MFYTRRLHGLYLTYLIEEMYSHKLGIVYYNVISVKEN